MSAAAATEKAAAAELVKAKKTFVRKKAMQYIGAGSDRTQDFVLLEYVRKKESATRADFDLELIESRTLDGHTQALIYLRALHA